MILNNTKFIEAVVLLSIFVMVEWLAHTISGTRKMFVPAVLFWGIYLVLRIAIIVTRTWRASDTPNSN